MRSGRKATRTRLPASSVTSRVAVEALDAEEFAALSLRDAQEEEALAPASAQMISRRLKDLIRCR